MTTIVRPAHPEDAEILARIHVEGWRAAYGGIVDPEFLASLDTGRRAQEWQSWLTQETMDVAIALDGETPCGFISTGKLRTPLPGMSPIRPLYSGEVYALYLLPDFWRRGVGTRLLREGAAALRARKHKSMCLWVLEKNIRGVSFYKKMGGERCGKKDIEIGKSQVRDICFGWRSIEPLYAALPSTE